METLKKISPPLFLLFLLVIGSAMSLVLCCGRYVIPANYSLFTAVLAVIGLFAVYFSIKGKDIRFGGKNAVLAAIPIGSAFFAAFYMYGTKVSMSASYSIFISTFYFFCGITMLYVCSQSKKLKIIMSIVYLIVIILPMGTVFAVSAVYSQYTQDSLIGTAVSPDGRYTAVVTQNYVSVIPTYKSKNIAIASIEPYEHIIYRSNDGSIKAEDVTIDNDAVYIGDIKHDLKYIGEANIFFNFSHYSDLLNVYTPQRYNDDYTSEYNDENAVYYTLYNLTDDEIKDIDDDAAKNTNWNYMNADKAYFKGIIQDTVIDSCDYYCFMSLDDYKPGKYHDADEYIAVFYSVSNKTEIAAEVQPFVSE